MQRNPPSDFESKIYWVTLDLTHPTPNSTLIITHKQYHHPQKSRPQLRERLLLVVISKINQLTT